MLDRVELETFFFVTKYGSLSEAALKMYVSQGTVSTRIKSLETNLGKQLLIRNKGGITITSPGKLLLNYVENLRYNENQFKEEFYESVSKQHSISIGISPVVTHWFYNNVINSVNHRLNVEVNFSNFIIENVVKQKYDLGIFRFEADHFTHPNLDSIPLAKDEVRFVAHRDHPIFKAANIDLERISHYPIIALGSEVNHLRIIYQVFENAAIFPKKIKHFTDLNAIRLFLLDKNSISILSSYLIQTSLDAEIYRVLDVRDLVDKERHSVLIYHRHIQQSEEVKEFIEFLRGINKLA